MLERVYKPESNRRNRDGRGYEGKGIVIRQYIQRPWIVGNQKKKKRGRRNGKNGRESNEWGTQSNHHTSDC